MLAHAARGAPLGAPAGAHCTAARRRAASAQRHITAAHNYTAAAAAAARGLGAGAPFTQAILPTRGFLPTQDPCRRLAGEQYAAWEEAAHELPKLYLASGTGRLRKALEELPQFSTAELVESGDDAQLWRAMLVLSFISHAYVWGEGAPCEVLPPVFAVPWCAVARALEVPPVLTYATYNILNWRRLDAAAPIELGNIVCLHNFSGGCDEEWFRLVHVAIEARAGPALAALPAAQAAAAAGDEVAVGAALALITGALRDMQAILGRMGEKCDPYIYYQRVRWPMSGWRNNAALPNGLIYGGVSPEPQLIYGETGAQSSIVPAFDAALGITHESTWLRDYLGAMRLHMPREHRQALASLEAATSLRECVQKASTASQLRDSYNEAVEELTKFRAMHKQFAATYITKQAPKEERGTGGSAFMPALTGYQRTTSTHVLP